MTALTHAKGATTLVSNQYAYNDANNISSWANASGSHAYSYDAVNRLTSVTTDGAPAENYGYDAVGNRTASHLSASYGYQPFNKLTSTATATYSYDNNGNVVSKTDALGNWSLNYDGENRLTQVVVPSGPTVNYKYDALGRRIQRTTSAGANERYVYDGADALADLNADSSVATTYLNAPGLDKHLRQTNATTGVSNFLFDHLGSAAALTDASGNVVEQLTYDSYGNSLGSARTRYGYTGRERDPDSGMLYYRARFYDPQTGRFIQTDPAGFGGRDTNLYGYVWNSAVNYRDPLGLDGWGNDAADWLDQRIEVAHRYWHYDDSEIIANGVNNSIADLSHGVADILRVGSGTGTAIFGPPDNGYGIAANIAMDVSRGAAIFGILGGGAARFTGGIASAPPTECDCPSFLGQENGPAIPVPKGASGPTPTRGAGVQYNGGSGGNGLSPTVNNVRIMDPTPQYPNGYVNYGKTLPNGSWQSVDPYTGLPISRASPCWHISR